MKNKRFAFKKEDQLKKTEEKHRPTLNEIEEFFQPEDQTVLKNITYTFIATERRK